MTKNITVRTTVNRPADATVLMSPSAALVLIHQTTTHAPKQTYRTLRLREPQDVSERGCRKVQLRANGGMPGGR